MSRKMGIHVFMIIIMSLIGILPTWAITGTPEGDQPAAHFIEKLGYEAYFNEWEGLYLEYDKTEGSFYINEGQDHFLVEEGEGTASNRFSGGNPQLGEGVSWAYLDIEDGKGMSLFEKRVRNEERVALNTYWIYENSETYDQTKLYEFPIVEGQYFYGLNWKNEWIGIRSYNRESRLETIQVGTFTDFVNGTVRIISLPENQKMIDFDLSEDGETIFTLSMAYNVETEETYTAIFKIDGKTNEVKEIRKLEKLVAPTEEMLAKIDPEILADLYPQELSGMKEDIEYGEWGIPIGELYCDGDSIVYYCQYYESMEWYMTRVRPDEKVNYMERINFNGELIDQLELDYFIFDLTSGGDDVTYFVQEDLSAGRTGENNNYTQSIEIYRVDWPERVRENKESAGAGRMRSLVAERNFHGTTIAKVESEKFNLLHPIQADGEKMNDCALISVRSKLERLALQIPYADIQEAKNQGCKSVRVMWNGQRFDFLLEELDCEEAWKAMSNPESAWVECTLIQSAEKITFERLELVSVEQVNGKTRLVHRFDLMK